VAAFAAAVTLRDAEDWVGAERILRRILKGSDDVPPAVNAVLGHVLWKQAQFTEAIPFLRRAAEQSPTNEGISLALFHCLFEGGRPADAISEGQRFLLLAGESPEYREVLEAVKGEFKRRNT